MCCCNLGGFVTSGPDQVMVVSGWGYTEEGFQNGPAAESTVDDFKSADGRRPSSFAGLHIAQILKTYKSLC